MATMIAETGAGPQVRGNRDAQPVLRSPLAIPLIVSRPTRSSSPSVALRSAARRRSSSI